MFLFCVGFALYYMSYLPESSMKMRYVNTPPQAVGLCGSSFDCYFGQCKHVAKIKRIL